MSYGRNVSVANAQNLMIVSLVDNFGESWGTRLISAIFLVGSPGAQASQAWCESFKK